MLNPKKWPEPTYVWKYHSTPKWGTYMYEPQHEISSYVVCATSIGSDQPAHMRSLIRSLASGLNIMWLISYWPNIISSF